MIPLMDSLKVADTTFIELHLIADYENMSQKKTRYYCHRIRTGHREQNHDNPELFERVLIYQTA
jgi:hypothetical protein